MRLLIIFAVVAYASAYACYNVYQPGYNHYGCKVSSACARATPTYYRPYCGYRAPPTVACANSRSYHCNYRPGCQKHIHIRNPCAPTTPTRKTRRFRTGSNLCVGDCLYSCRRHRFSC